MKLESIYTKPTSKIIEVISLIDQGSLQFALVVDDHNRLLGTVTDGDIRRALLRGESLENPVQRIMHRNFRFVNESTSEAHALIIMRDESLHQLPVLDDNGRVIRVFFLEDLIKPKKLSNIVVIMAGGEGKRLRPLTEHRPKPMLAVNGKPLLEIILERCIDSGFQNFYIAVNYLKEQIQEYFGDGANWNAKIEYLEEKKPLGTAGALSLLPIQPSQPLLVINADILTRVDYNQLVRFHAEHTADATMCVREHSIQIPYGVVQMNDLQVSEIEEKPIINHYVNAGIYLINPGLLELVPKNTFFTMPELLIKVIQQRRAVIGFPIHEYWVDIGRPETLRQAHGEWE